VEVLLIIGVVIAALAGFWTSAPCFCLGGLALHWPWIALANYFWMRAVSAKPDALDALGYVVAFIYPIAGCLVGKGVSIFRSAPK
jgi:hypothetical protein